MLYSVWHPGLKRYDYYQTRELERGTPTPHLERLDKGLAPEEAAWTLPSGAQRVGSGPLAKGMIAIQRGLGAISTNGGHTLIVLGGLGLAAYGLYRIWLPRSRKKRRSSYI